MSASAVLPQRRILGLIFLTVFMDIVGFSIIIPLFPHLLDHYIRAEGAAGTLIGSLNAAAEWLGGDTVFTNQCTLLCLRGFAEELTCKASA